MRLDVQPVVPSIGGGGAEVAAFGDVFIGLSTLGSLCSLVMQVETGFAWLVTQRWVHSLAVKRRRAW